LLEIVVGLGLSIR